MISTDRCSRAREFPRIVRQASRRVAARRETGAALTRQPILFSSTPTSY
jgi:hypothetical protein